METYIVIAPTEDGTWVRMMTEEALLKALENGDWGDHVTIASAIPDESNSTYWGDVVVIIKGHVVQPEPVEIVTKYTFEKGR